MNQEKFAISGLMLFTPSVLGDHRGFFFESFRASWLETDKHVEFVQENQSFSTNKTLRGLHYQTKQTQGKLVRVLQGRVFDVAVDMREGSDTFGQWQGVYLDDQLHQSFWVPRGFAHGFVVVSETAQLLYKCTDYYHPKSEVSLAWNDATLNIEWPVVDPIISKKDEVGMTLQQAPKIQTPSGC